jgi:hypothetical protein
MSGIENSSRGSQEAALGPRRAGQRTGRVDDRRDELYLCLLRHFERVANFDTQVPYSAFNALSE